MSKQYIIWQDVDSSSPSSLPLPPMDSQPRYQGRLREQKRARGVDTAEQRIGTEAPLTHGKLRSVVSPESKRTRGHHPELGGSAEEFQLRLHWYKNKDEGLSPGPAEESQNPVSSERDRRLGSFPMPPIAG